MVHAMTVSRFLVEVLTGCATALFGLVVVLGATEFGIGWGDAGPEPGYFPFYVGLLIIAGSIGVLVQAFVLYRGRSLPFLDSVQARRIAAFFAPVIAFVVASLFIGLYAATAIYLAAVMRVQGGYRLHTSIAVAICTTLFFYVVFEIWFQVPLLKGPLEAWLGLA
jgi:hypothetical protein